MHDAGREGYFGNTKIMIKMNIKSRKAFQMGWEMVITILITVVVLVIIIFTMKDSNSVVWAAWGKIKEVFPFV